MNPDLPGILQNLERNPAGKSLHNHNEPVSGRDMHVCCNISNEAAILKSIQPYLILPTAHNNTVSVTKQ